LSAGEYVVNARAVSRPGILALLEQLNQLGTLHVRRPRYHFADGGLVDVGPVAAAAGGRSTMEIGLDDALILKRIALSPEFDRAVIRSASNNRKSFNAALGR
jgi:hypothetical protein